jgi:hypothetical protein
MSYFGTVTRIILAQAQKLKARSHSRHKLTDRNIGYRVVKIASAITYIYR